MATSGNQQTIAQSAELSSNNATIANRNLTVKHRQFKTGTVPGWKSDHRDYPILNKDAAAEMAKGSIPNLENLCYQLFDALKHSKPPYSALQFIPVLKNLKPIDTAAVERFLQNPKTNHVLVQTDFMKVVLIHWKPGKQSSVHGHMKGGCVFKVLQGKLVEKRYSGDQRQQFLAASTYHKDSMAYIDDQLAYHAVGNPFNSPAISIHAYTTGGM